MAAINSARENKVFLPGFALAPGLQACADLEDEAEKKAHLDRGLVKALNRLDEVLALIRASRTAFQGRTGEEARRNPAARCSRAPR